MRGRPQGCRRTHLRGGGTRRFLEWTRYRTHTPTEYPHPHSAPTPPQRTHTHTPPSTPTPTPTPGAGCSPAPPPLRGSARAGAALAGSWRQRGSAPRPGAVPAMPAEVRAERAGGTGDSGRAGVLRERGGGCCGMRWARRGAMGGMEWMG